MEQPLRELQSESDVLDDERNEVPVAAVRATEAAIPVVDEPLDKSGDLAFALKSMTDRSTRSAIAISSSMSVIGFVVAVILFASLARGIPSMWLVGACMSILAVGTAAVFAAMSRIFKPGKRRRDEILKLVKGADKQQIVPLLNALQYDDPGIHAGVCQRLTPMVQAISVEEANGLPDETLAGLSLLLAKPGLNRNHPGIEFTDAVSDLAGRMGVHRFLAPIEKMAVSKNKMLAFTVRDPVRILRRRFGLPHDQETLLRPADNTDEDLLRPAPPSNSADISNLLQPSSQEESQDDS